MLKQASARRTASACRWAACIARDGPHAVVLSLSLQTTRRVQLLVDSLCRLTKQKRDAGVSQVLTNQLFNDTQTLSTRVLFWGSCAQAASWEVIGFTRNGFRLLQEPLKIYNSGIAEPCAA